MSRRGVGTLLGAVTVFLTTFAGPLHAQAGPWVPVGSALDRDVRWAIDAGALTLNPLVRPFRLVAVRRAVESADTAEMSGMRRRALENVRLRLPAPDDSLSLAVEAGLHGYRHPQRESFRAAGDASIQPVLGVWASASSGPVVAVINPAIEGRLRDDIEFVGARSTEVTGRLQAAYVALSGDRGDLVFGRMARNWGPGTFGGLLLSDGPYAFDGLGGALRIGPLELTSLAQRLSSVPDSSGTGISYQRFFFAHRLDIRLGTRVWLGLVETGTYGGPGQTFEPALHAPLNLGIASAFNDSIDNINSMLGADLAVQLRPGLRFEGSAFLDDIQTDRQVLTDRRPASYGASLTLTAALPAVPVHLTLGYTRVSALAYRNSFDPLLEYSHQHVGMGRNRSDYDEWLLRTEVRLGMWSVSADLAWFRQGSGDFRQPFPNDTVLATPGQGFLVAPVQRYAAARVFAIGLPRPGLRVSAELGLTRDTSGSSRGVASASLALTADLLRRGWGSSYPAIERSADRGWP